MCVLRRKNHRPLVVFALKNFRQFSLRDFTNCVLCVKNLQENGGTCNIFKTYENVGYFSYTCFFIGSIHMSSKLCSTKHSLGNTILESRTTE